MAAYQSLYRRYRPQRFDEVLGQDHITKALRNAVRDGRVGHAYLFSGPRGTGKTSTARILAKVLNCAAPVDGEPCGQCDNCVAVAVGRITDWLLEQDAASKSKVDDMRDLLERVPLGTSGTRKVIILDEVHMLSQGAENALLKTLEEPPAHVVFVLATTDPQKVRPTIRSRTQHFEFRLLPPDVLAEHVRHVIADSGLALDAAAVDRAVDHVIRSGGGSARDTLSALDQVAALGEVVDEDQPVDAVLDAVAERDAGSVLVAVADALAAGRDPRTLGEALISALRDAFLAVMGAADDHLAPAERERAGRIGARLGPAGLTRALDVLGEALVELSRKPDPRIVVEVALVRLTQPSTDRSLDAILERLDRLERTGGGGSGSEGGSGSANTPAAVEPAAEPRLVAPAGSGGGDGGRGSVAGGGAAAARAALSGQRGRRATGSDAPPSNAPDAAGPDAEAPPANDAATDDAPESTAAAGSADETRAPTLGAVVRGRKRRSSAGEPVTSPSPTPGPVTPPSPAPGPGGHAGSVPGRAELSQAWGDVVLAALPPKVRSRWRGGQWVEPDAGRVCFAVPNEWHRKACDESRREVEQALASHFSTPVAVTVVVEGGGGDDGVAVAGAGGPSSGGGGARPGAAGRVSSPDVAELEHIDPAELRDAEDVPTNGIDLVVRAFGGGELVEEEQ